ncbi:hypothetical protein RDWZM_006506 [Blomia tropicalis]|uniref:Protein kinase domain-containing protein n=1 Tax=Blomia tropicalis TaxID=40697 RepID=A0A9Q0M880_BLOTA|nr:hypothetical protein RDWZM_006506 [Blomia tropicalis]
MSTINNNNNVAGRNATRAIRGRIPPGSFLNDTVPNFRPRNEPAMENDMRFFDIQRELVNMKFEVTEMELCGSGAFGRVFSCFATENGVKTSEKFAVKVIRAESLALYTLNKWRHRSTREMFYLQNLEHNNIVKLFDYMWLDHPARRHFPAFLAMKFEFLETDLEKMSIKMGAMPLETLVSITKQIGSAIAHMHSRRLINHDIKPANIMVEKLDQNGNIDANSVYKLIDFGLARHTNLTYGSQVKCKRSYGGTKIFMCPEKIGQNNIREYDVYKSDSYSFGVTLLSLAVGYNNFRNILRFAGPVDIFTHQLRFIWNKEITHPYLYYIIGKLIVDEPKRLYVKDILNMLENPPQHKLDHYFYLAPPNDAPTLKD